MAYWRKKKKDEGFDTDAKGKVIEAGEDAQFGDEIYAELKEDEEESLVYDQSDQESDEDDEEGEKVHRRLNKAQDWIIDED